MKILVIAAAALTAGMAFADLTVRVTDEGTFEEKGLKLETRRPPETFTFRKLGGRMAATWREAPYVRVDYGKTIPMRKPEECGTKEFAVEVEYFDAVGAKGQVMMTYDSMDEVGAPFKYAPGAWRSAGQIAFTGSGTWKKVTFGLPWARFDRKALNGYDFRFDPFKGMATKAEDKWGIGSIRLFVRDKTPEAIDPKDLTVLENDALRLEFDGFRVRRLFDKKRNLSIIDAPSIAPSVLELACVAPQPKDFFRTNMEEKVAKRELEKFKMFGAETTKPVLAGTKDEPVMKLFYKLKNGVVAEPAVKLTKAGQLEWTLSLTCPEKVEVYEINYPRVWGVALGGDPKDDFCYNGDAWRQVWVGAYTRSPGKNGSMTRFQIMWDEKVALYLGIEDPDQNDYWFFINMDGCGGAQMGASEHIRAKAGETWNGHGTVWRMAVTDGGTWHKAAAIGRAWNKKTLHAPDVPPYVKWLVDGWVYPNANDFPWQGWDTLNTEDWDRWSKRSYGTNDLWYADAMLSAGGRQMIDGACAAYCGMNPYPCPVWGSVREFKEKVAISRALGSFYMPYFNFNLYAPGYCRHGRIGAFAKSRLPKGEMAVTGEDWYKQVAGRGFDGKVDMRVLDQWFDEYPMNIISPAWRTWQMDWMTRYAEWGIDGAYYDQLNAAYGNTALWPDYEESYGSWLKASRDSVKRIKEACRKINPYVAYSGELANEIIAQEVDISMTSAVIDHHEIFRFANPWAIVIDGRWNGGNQNNKYRFNWQSGARFEQGMSERRHYIALRRRVKSLLYDAEFRDGEDLVCKYDGVVVPERYPLAGDGQLRYPLNDGLTAKWFLFKSKSGVEVEGRGAIVNVINCKDEKKKDKWGNYQLVKTTVGTNATVTVPTAEIGEVKAAWAFTLDGACSRLSPRVSRPGFVEIPVPESEATSIILSNGKLRPLVAWEHDPVLTPGAKGTVKLKVTNVNDQPMNVSVKLRLPKGWQMGDATACRVNEDGSIHFQRGEDTASPMTRQAAASPFALPPGETRDIDVAYVVADDAPLGRHDLWADVKGEVVRQETGDKNGLGLETGDANSSTFSAYCYAVVNEPLLMDFRGHAGSYHVWFRNLSEEPIKGTLTAKPIGTTVLPFAKGGPRDVDAAEMIKVSVTNEEVVIPARGVVRVPVFVEGFMDLTEYAEMEATFKTGVWPFSKKISRVKSVKPVIPNRDFELDYAGDMKPDWWMCRANWGDWAYQCMNLSTNAHSGKYAIEVKPFSKTARSTGAYTTYFDGIVGKTYKYTFWYKNASKGARAGVDGGVHLPVTNVWTKIEQVKQINRVGAAAFGVNAGNDGPVLVDDVTVEEVKK